MQNKETNRIDPLVEVSDDNFLKAIENHGFEDVEYYKNLLNAQGEPIPKHEIVFKLGELVEIKNYTYRVAYIGETAILFEPVKPSEALEGGKR